MVAAFDFVGDLVKGQKTTRSHTLTPGLAKNPEEIGFSLPLLKLPPSFVGHHGGMPMRLEGFQMLSALIGAQRRADAPAHATWYSHEETTWRTFDSVAAMSMEEGTGAVLAEVGK